MSLGIGKHIVKVTDAYLTESNTGTIGIVWIFSNKEGSIDCTRWVTPKTVEYVMKDMDTLGFHESELNTLDDLDKIKTLTMGHECSISVEEEEYNGAPVNKVRWINPVGPPKMVKADTKQRAFDILKGRNVAPRSAPRPQSAGRPQEPQPFAPDLDDTPF